MGARTPRWKRTSPTFTHTFPAAGTYLVALTVMNADGTSNGTAQTITIGASAPPTATFTDSAPALEGTSVTFTGSGHDPNSGGSITSYAWSYGDGGTGAGATSNHTYSHFGAYTVTLTVTDNLGLSGSVSHTVTITDEAPTAAFTFSPASPVVGSNVSFDGTGSGDSDGHVASWSWNYGDGSAAGSGATSSHTYAHAGSYTATLTITDNDSQSASISHAVVVTPGSAPPPTYLPPTARFAGGSGQENVPVSLSGSGSTDPNAGGSLSYAWSFGDGATAAGATVTHAFHAGSWNVTLTVTDSISGLKGSASHLVVVADEAPRAAFTDPTGQAGQVIAFSGSGSDTDGSIAAYMWNFGDGVTATGSHPTHVYAAAGSLHGDAHRRRFQRPDRERLPCGVHRRPCEGLRRAPPEGHDPGAGAARTHRRPLRARYDEGTQGAQEEGGQGKALGTRRCQADAGAGEHRTRGKPGRAEARLQNRPELSRDSGQRPRTSAVRHVRSHSVAVGPESGYSFSVDHCAGRAWTNWGA